MPDPQATGARALALALLGLLSLATPALGKEKWKPVTPGEMALSKSAIEPDAGAEAIFWDRRVEDDFHLATGEPQVRTTNYVRVKILDERGKKLYSQVELEYDGRGEIDEVAARTIRPDGSIVEVSKDSIFDVSLSMTRDKDTRAVSFAAPALEPGAILEYQWRELAVERLTNYNAFFFQLNIPIQKATLTFRALDAPGYSIKTKSFRCTPSPWVRNNDKSATTTVTNLPSGVEEPAMPPFATTRPWILVFYSDDDETTPAGYWKHYGKRITEIYEGALKPTGGVRRLAEDAIRETTEPEERLRRLWDSVRRSVTLEAHLTGEARKKMRPITPAGDTLAARKGTVGNVNVLFVAAARAAGFEARIAHVSSRRTFFFDPSHLNAAFLNDCLAAVKVPGTGGATGASASWRILSPGDARLPYGVLRWEHEGEHAFLIDGKDSFFVKVPVSPPRTSIRKHTARLELLADGTLTGTARIEDHGSYAVERRDAEDEAGQSQRESSLREALEKRIPGIEITNVVFEGFGALEGPVVTSFSLRVPGWATRTGKRLIVPPAFFRRGIPARFTSTTRLHPIYQPLDEVEEDDLTLSLPAGWALEDFTWLPAFTVGANGLFLSTLTPDEARTSVSYGRRSRLPGGLFPPSAYPQIRRMFDRIQEIDAQMIVLREVPPS